MSYDAASVGHDDDDDDDDDEHNDNRNDETILVLTTITLIHSREYVFFPVALNASQTKMWYYDLDKIGA